MHVERVRQCYASGWTVEFQLNGATFDFEFINRDEADRFFHLLQAMAHFDAAQNV